MSSKASEPEPEPEPEPQPEPQPELSPSASGGVDKAMRRFAVRVSAVGSVGGLLFGYDLGVVNSALLQLSHHFDLQRPEEKGLVVSILLAGSVLGALFGGVLTDKYGRRAAIIGTDLVFIVGGSVLALAPSLPVVLVGRFIVGIGVSVSAIADVAYLNEMAPQKWRGTIVSVNELMIAGGFLLANLVGGLFSATEGGWRYMFGFAAALAAAQLLGISSLPRSPRWLLLQGRKEEAHASLVQIYGGSEQRATVVLGSLARATEEEAAELAQSSSLGSLLRWRPQLQVAVLLFFFAQLSGQSNVLSYASEMFARAAGCEEIPTGANATAEQSQAHADCEATAVRPRPPSAPLPLCPSAARACSLRAAPCRAGVERRVHRCCEVPLRGHRRLEGRAHLAPQAPRARQRRHCPRPRRAHLGLRLL